MFYEIRFKILFSGTYCMPEEGVQLSKKESLLKSDEIIRLVSLFSRLGVNKIRFTGNISVFLFVS